jgi:hypothetical protein
VVEDLTNLASLIRQSEHSRLVAMKGLRCLLGLAVRGDPVECLRTDCHRGLPSRG